MNKKSYFLVQESNAGKCFNNSLTILLLNPLKFILSKFAQLTKYNVISRSDIERIKLFIQGNADEEEKQYICSLFSKNKNNHEFQQFIKAEFYECFNNDDYEEQNLDYILNRIHRIINK